jgi:hypothetical protein
MFRLFRHLLWPLTRFIHSEVHLLGNWFDNSSDQPPFGSDDEDSDEDGEGAFRLEDVSSDVEMDPETLMMDDDDESDGGYEIPRNSFW